MAADLPLVGRRAELAALTSALSPGAGPRVVVLVGEAGVGKTRLIGEAVRRCAAAGVRTLMGGCLPLAESVPFLPITEALHGLSPGGPPPALDRCAAHVRTELGRLMPGWSDTAVPEPSAEWARGRLFAALRDLLAALDGDGPHALVVEDLHWADPSTRDLLAYLGAVRTLPMVLTCREEEIDPGSWLIELERRPGLVRLPLTRLSRTEVAEHVGALLGRTAAPRYVDEVFARAGGNAFFTEQLVAAGRGAAMPAGLAQLLLRRVETVDADARSVLGALAIAARETDEDLLSALTGLAGNELARAIRGLTRARLIGTPDEKGRYRLRHALVGEAVAAAMTAGERRQGHARMARQVGAGASAELAAEVAGHWAAAGVAAEELPPRLTAAREAGRVFAYREAATHWLRLIELWPLVPPGGRPAEPDLADVYLSALDALDRCGDAALADRTADDAVRKLGGWLDKPRLALLHERVARYRWLNDEASLPRIELAMDLLSDAPPARPHAVVTQTYASILRDLGRISEARAMLEQGLAACRAAGLVAERIKILRDLAGLSEHAGDVATGQRLLTEAKTLAEQHGDALLISGVAYQYAESQFVLGNLATAADLAGAALDRALKAGLEGHYSAELLVFCRFEALAEAGRIAEAEAAVPATAEATIVSSAALARAYLTALAGDYEAAAARLTEIEHAMSPINFTDGEYVIKRGEIELWLGCPADALARVRELPRGIIGTLLFGYTGSALRVATQACADLAETARNRNDAAGDEAARRWAQELVAEHEAMRPDPFAPHPYWSFAPAEHATWRAELTRVAGTPDPAAWAEAAGEWARLGRPHRAAYARWRQSEAFLAGGHRAEAAHALRAAADGADGNAPLLAGIQQTARLARLSLRAAQPATGTSPYGLTAREQAVLALIAEGLTNVRIGRRLFISESTVSVHVTNLMRKLGVTNRAQAAALAQRAGLLPEQRPRSGVSQDLAEH